MKDITLYTWRTCPYCKKAKQVLTDNGYDFVDVDITDTPEKKEELTQQTGQHTVPYVFVEDDLIGGSSDLIELIDNGKFEEIIAE